MTPNAKQLYDAIDRTWPAARCWTSGQWTLRDGQGGGKRVSAATANGDVTKADIAIAEAAMMQIGQAPLFMIREDEEELDALLAEHGYEVIDPVILYSLPLAKLTDVAIPRVTAFHIWEPLAIMREIWASGGIGPERLEVMARAAVKTAIFARWNEKPGGVGFAAMADDLCMVHAVEVPPHQRRQGVAQWIMRRAAFWAESQGARHMAVLCVEDNLGANALYRGLGFVPSARYHYRHKPD
ncbi:MAG: GNAT family N-acetyltransferase [Sulfitobacter sp.]